METVSEKGAVCKHVFCGIDLHDRSMLAAISEDRGTPRYESFDTMEDEGVTDLLMELHELQECNPGSVVHVAYEASGCGFVLLDILVAEGFVAAVLAPTHLPSSPKSRTDKTDKKDALRVLEVVRGSVLAGNRLPTVWIPPEGLRDDREIVRRRLELGEDLTRTKNRIHGLLRRFGIKRPKAIKSLWTQKHVRWLERKLGSSMKGQVKRRSSPQGLFQVFDLEGRSVPATLIPTGSRENELDRT